nr:hypothetical protein [Lachnospiraceae bacterium]
VGSEVTEASEEATYSVQADDTSTTTKTVSDPSADPSTWTTDPASAEKTFMLYLRGLLKDDTLAVSHNKIVNGKVVVRDAVPASQNMAISINNLIFESEHIQDDYYLLLAYGINEGEGVNTLAYDGSKIVPAGIYDSQKFTWHAKNVSAKNNGKIYFDAAVVTWEKAGEKAELVETIKVSSLSIKNNQYATVSHDAVSENGKIVWESIYNAYNKSNKQPYFTYKLKATTVKNKEYGDKNNKLKATKAEKALVKALNTKLKTKQYPFEIRRRDLVDYDLANPSEQIVYAELKDDVLKFSKNGKNVTAIVQVRVPYSLEDNTEEDTSEETAKGKSKEKAEAKATSMELIIPLKKIGKNNQYPYGTEKKGDYTWFRYELPDNSAKDLVDTSKKNGQYYDDIFVVQGVNNFENNVAFRIRNDNEESIGSGFFIDKDVNYITMLED